MLLFFSHISGGQYLLGDYDLNRDKFVVTHHDKFNFGSYNPAGVHAPSATPDGQGGIIVIFNMNPGKPTKGWDQIMTLPRRLTLIGNDTVGTEPIGDIESLRYNYQHIDTVKLPANEEVIINDISGNAMEIAAKIDTKEAPMIELNVLRSPNKEEFTRIAFFRNRGFRNRGQFPVVNAGPNFYESARYSLISIDSSYSSLSPDVLSRAPETGSFIIGQDESLQLRVFIDKSIVEVFVNGKQCLALRVYPSRNDSVGISLRSQGQDAKLISLDAWQMKNIYD